jgi:hypothetical protein
VKAVVIGNGESRSKLNLLSFKPNHVLVGCNAIHRDLTVNHLVCCDRRMVEEAVNNPNTTDTLIYVRDDWFKYYRKIQKRKNIQQVPDLPYVGELKQDRPEHWGSGGYAVLIAANLNVDEVLLVGFDLYSKNNKVNNIYKGTANYSKSDGQSVDYSFWVEQISKIFFYYPNIKFNIINEATWEMPRCWKQDNVSFTNIDELIA